jgi:hypothetical protein
MGKTEDELLEEVVDQYGLLQLLVDARLTDLEVALHLHHCGLLDLEVYLDDRINTREY